MSGKVFCSITKHGSNYSNRLLAFEEDFDSCLTFTWLEHNWHLCNYLIAVYLAVVFAGRRIMQTRPAFKFQTCLFFWNSFLAIFSIMASWRMIPAIVVDVIEHGFHDSVCTFTSDQHKEAIGIWVWLFILSKVLEFGDTVFLVLRKSPLTFLHLYHHVSVAFFVWFCGGAYMSKMNVYFGTFNVLVHSVMYSYYALAVVKIPIPVAVRMAITCMQLIQMIFGIFLTGYIYHQKTTNWPCFVPDQAITIAICIYFSYFVLFLNYFIRTYVMMKPKITQSKKWN